MADGVELRLNALRQDGYFAICAMDHGLSYGVVPQLSTNQEIFSRIVDIRQAGVSSFVLNLGLLQSLDPHRLSSALSGARIVGQIVGAPMSAANSADRVVVGSVESAVAAGADAVSVQLRPSEVGSRPEILEAVCSIALRSHELGLPVLLMLNGNNWQSAGECVDSVRAFGELPVDIVKFDPGHQMDELPKGVFNDLPVKTVVAGGEQDPAFVRRLEVAVQAGVDGVCVGRNLFQAPSPTAVMSGIRDAFNNA